MNKKSVAASIVTVFIAITAAVIGSCFVVFVYKDNIIKFEEVKVVAANGISVYDNKKMEKTISKLKLSDMELGLKPATGKVDAESEIPSTVTSDDTSEGYYEKIYVKSSSNYKIVVKDIVIKTTKNQTIAEGERENIFIAIEGVKNTTKTLEKDEFELVRFEKIEEPQNLVLLFWLGANSGEELVGSKISFTIEFLAV